MTALVALAAIVLSLLAGSHRRGALVGAGSASLTAVASLVFMQRGARATKPLQAALLVMVVMFLLRIVVVALGTAFVWRAGESIFGFIVAFFVPFFIFAAIEGYYLHGLPRGTGPTA
jgi:hypothetical protein